jgi:hypothetical protein
VQRSGWARFGPAFRFLGYELGRFHRSDPASRERTGDGTVGFAFPTDLGDEFIIFSGTIARGLARYRLDPDHRRPGLVSPFEPYRFEHPGTRWYNLRNAAGADKYFVKNSPAVLDFFAALVARNIRAGRRTLLVAKKKFLKLCAEGLTRRLEGLGVGPVSVVTGGWDEADLADPRTIPLINYGVCGVNRFEGHDAAYCLTAYYVSAATVEASTRALEGPGGGFAVRVVTGGDPPRRTAVVDPPGVRETILPALARWTLEQKEADVVVQAVGRVRPFTRPREVITFQLDDLPDVRYTHDFRSLAEARAWFGLATRRRATADAKAAEARRLRALGLSIGRVAEEMGVSASAVKRYIRSLGGS